MFLIENPVLQRELLVNLRMTRAFALLLVYIGLLGVVVYTAWPNEARVDVSSGGDTAEASRLVTLFFLGQYVLVSLMVPSFAAGTITGEKERQTYEMLLASPMPPRAVILGKLLAALCHLAILVFCSLPIVMLCLPLGGVSPYEVLATYIGMAASVALFGMICVAASSYFTRTIAALVVSYLIVLPLTLLGILVYSATASETRLVLIGGILPVCCVAAAGALLSATSRRLLHPPDIGAEAKDVVDPDLEQKMAVGMVIRSDQFPDKLFAPPKRTDLMADGTNPIFDKEMRSELFGQGTLMLRLVIQLSMLLALPLMAVCLYIKASLAPWYACYVVLFNVLVGPTFAAHAISGEREGQTLELLLTTALSPWQIMSGKLYAWLRVSVVLTAFIIWPLFLAWLLPPWTYASDSWTILRYLIIVILVALTTTTLAMFCSVIFSRTSVSLMTTYLVLLFLYAAPVAVWVFAQMFSPTMGASLSPNGAIATGWEDPHTWLHLWTSTSPVAAAFSLPLTCGETANQTHDPVRWWHHAGTAFMVFYLLLDVFLLGAMLWLFHRRWRVWS